MISERHLAEHFHSFWQYHLPLLDSRFVRRFGAERKQRLHSAAGEAILEVVPKQPDRLDLVAEIAFELARTRYEAEEGVPTDDSLATKLALDRMAAFAGGGAVEAPTDVQIQDAMALADNYGHFFDTVASGAQLLFRPRIRGAGVLNGMEADFCSTATLYEAKTVSRNLQAPDLRQVAIYVIAGIGSREYAWSEFCVFNPRQAIYYSGNIKDFLAYVSGRPPAECIADVLSALMEREEPLESRF